MTELTEHLEDLIAEGERAGLDREAAERSALSRLGDTENLAKTMIARRELRAWSHRSPWIVFLLGPLVSLVAINLASLVLFMVIVDYFGSGSAHVPMFVPSWFRGLYAATTEFDLFLLPLAVGWAISYLAVRQRMKPLWPIAGLVVIAVFCGLQTYEIQWSSIPNGLNGFGASWPFVPHGSRITVATGCRVLLNIGLMVTLYSLWRSQRLRRTTGIRQRV
ncbi:MAG TPA: permease prefix domain 1-containing protein [Steroidobacteraceae bacterium]|nr:permease prefix domain 1-containing protein [Steroidobacteraceae bacterium]